MCHQITPHHSAKSALQRHLKLITLLCCCLLLVSSVASAQSGRKQKKTTPEPPPQGVKAPEKTEDSAKGHSDSDQPLPEEKEKEKAPAHRFLVATDLPEVYIPLMYLTIVREGCVRELRTNPTIQATEAQQMNRAEAIKTAKNGENVYVIWMELRADNYSNDGFELLFALFEPKTGKQIASGFGYPTMQSGRNPLPPIGASRVEVRLELSGRDVARRAMAKLQSAPGGKGRFPTTSAGN